MKKVSLFLKQYIEFVVLFIGCVFFFFSSGRYNIPISAWIYPLCFIYFFRNMKRKWHIVFPIVLVIILGACKWYPFFDNPDVLIFFVGALASIEFLGPTLVDYLLFKKIKGFKETLIYPLTFVTIDLIMMYLPTSNTGSIAATQSGFLVFIQSASLFGSLFITFILTWFPTIVLYIISLIKDKKKVRVPLTIYVSIFTFMMLYGGIRVNALKNMDTFKVSMVADYFEDIDSCYKQTSKYMELASGAKADILIANEEYVYVKKSEEENVVNTFAQYAKENNIFFLTGLETHEDGKLGENKSYLFDNNGSVVFTYIKNKLVPFDETGHYITGDGSIPNKEVTFPSGKKIKLASMICFDSDFPQFVRNKVDNDAGTLLVPTWDWTGIRDYHSSNVVYRAIENGCSYIRATYDGISSVIDPSGRVTSSYNTYGNGLSNVVFGEATYKPVFTLYKYIGIVTDWLFPASLIAIITYQCISDYRKKKISIKLSNLYRINKNIYIFFGNYSKLYIC